jgi:DNA-binding HxlR family transcriptional regulator
VTVTTSSATTTPPALGWSTENCQVARTMAVLGERATIEVLREVFNGVRRFDDMHRHSGVARQVLSNRLAMLVEEGILRRVPYQPDGARVRHEYRPTPKGLDLYPILTALADWGAKYVADPEGPSVEMAHRGCGSPVHAVLECESGHRLDDPREVAPVPGPSATRVDA